MSIVMMSLRTMLLLAFYSIPGVLGVKAGRGCCFVCTVNCSVVKGLRLWSQTQENLAAVAKCQCCIAVLFWLFFKKIIHNSKSIGPFDLTLILLGALAHFSQDSLGHFKTQ